MENELSSHRYWNDKDVLQKLGEAMGLAVGGDATTSADNAGADEAEEAGNEDESIVHHTASVGDAEVWLNLLLSSFILIYLNEVIFSFWLT